MVYFVLRSQYHAPLGHQLVTFKDNCLLTWFQNHWIGERDGPWRSCPDLPDILPARPIAEWEEEEFDLIMDQFESSIFGIQVYGFWAMWGAMKTLSTAPQSYEELCTFLSTIGYPEGELSIQNHALEAITNDDEIEIAWYLFDDRFLAQHPERVRFLLTEDWQLPTSATQQGHLLPSPLSRSLASTPEGEEGATYCALLSAMDGETIMDITGCYRFDNQRLPTLASHLCSHPVPMITEEWEGSNDRPHRYRKPSWPEELVLLRAFLFDHPGKTLGEVLQAADSEELFDRISNPRGISDFRCGNNETVLTGDANACQWDWQRYRAHRISSPPSNSAWESTQRSPLIQNSDHLVQIRFVVDSSYEGYRHCCTWAYLFFDDLWAGENAELAESILHYGRGWSVLA